MAVFVPAKSPEGLDFERIWVDGLTQLAKCSLHGFYCLSAYYGRIHWSYVFKIFKDL